MKQHLRREKRNMRHKRIRAKVFGTTKIPRLCVFRSSSHIYAQLIDDDKKQTILSVDDRELRKEKENKEKKGAIARTGKVAIAYKAGKLIAQLALKNKIERVVFDRGGYKYHGRVKALAEGAREEGLKF